MLKNFRNDSSFLLHYITFHDDFSQIPKSLHSLIFRSTRGMHLKLPSRVVSSTGIS